MKLILSFEASDPDWFHENPQEILVIEVKDEDEKKIIDGIRTAIANYKKEEKNWNYGDAIQHAKYWLESEGYAFDPENRKIEKIDLG